MLMDSILLIILLLFSFIIFFINNYYVLLGILIISIILKFIFKVKLKLKISLIFFLLISFSLNYLFSNIENALLVSIRLVIMYLMVNLFVKKAGFNNISYLFGNLFHSKTIYIITSITLNFIPILIKELKDTKKVFYTKNYPFCFKNIILKPNIFIVNFFSNLFKTVLEMERVLIARGFDE